MEKAIQTEIQKMTDVGTQTDRLPTGAVIIQKAEKAKKKSSMKKRQIRDVPNAIPSQEQRFRIFKEIDYPYLMRNVETQNEEDKMIRALREVFGIKEKTPEVVAEEALEKSVIKGRSYPTFTEEEMTQQEKRIKALNSDSSLKKKASVRGLFDDIDAEAEESFIPPELTKSIEDYNEYLKAYVREYFPAGAKTSKEIDVKKEYEKSLKREEEKRKQLEKEAKKNIFEMGGMKPLETRGRPAKEGKTLELPTSTKSKEASALSIQQAIRNKIASKTLEDAMVNYSINKEFNNRLEQMKKERERQDKEIERSFGLYEASQRARKEGEMASLLFDY